MYRPIGTPATPTGWYFRCYYRRNVSVFGDYLQQAVLRCSWRYRQVFSTSVHSFRVRFISVGLSFVYFLLLEANVFASLWIFN